MATMDRPRYVVLSEEVRKVELAVERMATFETRSRDAQLAPHRGTNEALLCGLETIACDIQSGETTPVHPLSQPELDQFAERMLTLADRARQIWNQPAGRYQVSV